MKRRWFLAGVAALVVSGGVAEARLKTGPIDAGSGHRLKSLPVVNTMGTALSAAYSFRKVVSAYSGPAVKLRRVATGTMVDVGFTASGDFDTSAAAAHCTTQCQIETWYDQSGLGRHASREAGVSPAYVPDCIGEKPCARATGVDYLKSASVAWASVKTSFSVVANRSAGPTAPCNFVMKGANNSLATHTVASTWIVSDAATNSFTMPAADSAWHAGVGIINGPFSLGRIDAAEMPGANIAGVSTAGTIVVAYAPSAMVCDMTEAILWDNYALTLDERIALTQNQKDYYTPLPLDTFATPAAAYSFRRLKSTYSGPAVRLRRASDSAEQDINFLGFTSFTGAPIDTVAANAHCTSACTVAVWYDQSGNARHATLGITLPYIAGCIGNQPCVRSSANQYMESASVAWAAGKTSFGVVANRSAGTSGCNWLRKGGNHFLTAAANTWVVTDNVTNSYNIPATDAAWHAAAVTIDAASSAWRLDGTDGAGSNTTGTGAAGTALLNYGGVAVGAACDLVEGIIWDNYALTQPERAALTANQRAFWGF